MSNSTSRSDLLRLPRRFYTSQGTCQVTERSPIRTIEHLLDEVLLEIFDFYRQDIVYQWKENHSWLDLAHVCRNWRAITYASSSRLHLGITVGPRKPVHIKTILSSHQALPILLDFKYLLRGMTASSIWRMRYALEHRDRVRNIVFRGTNAGFNKFFNATDCAFPVLESVTLYFDYGYKTNIPDTFLGDQIYRICIYGVFDWTASLSHSYRDFYPLQRLLLTFFCESILFHQKSPFSSVCKA